jgi:hypothetical protein
MIVTMNMYQEKDTIKLTSNIISNEKKNRYESEKRQQNFRAKLTCVVDTSHTTYQDIGDLNFNKRSEWKKIKYVIFKTK